VGLFRRRKETLNEKLLREAGLDSEHALGEPPPRPEAPEAPQDPEPLRPWDRVLNANEPHRWAPGPRDWDATAAVQAPGLGGDRIEFTTIPNGDVIVSEETGDADVSPLADALEQHVSPPYRAVATRQDGDLWGVGAKRIEVAEIPFPQGDRLQLSHNGVEDELLVDGEPSDAAVPRGLEKLGEAVGGSFYVEADRIDGDLWEVKASPV
jgi:hypothetical protein